MGKSVLSIDAKTEVNLKDIKPNRLVREVEYTPGQEFKVKVVGKSHQPDKVLIDRVEVKLTAELKTKIAAIPKNVRGSILRAIVEYGIKDYEKYGLDLLNQNK